MKFLLDQDAYFLTTQFLKNEGFHVLTAASLGLSRAKDEELLLKAQELGCILITRDRDFGNLVFVKRLGTGVIYLRMVPATLHEVHQELLRVLSMYSHEQLAQSFVVVHAQGHRIRHVPRGEHDV